MKKILIIGETSFVATKVIKYFSSCEDIELIIPPLQELDITKIESLKKFIQDTNVVINFAAFTNVKHVTLDREGLAWKLNVEGAANVAKVCKDKNKFLIHISTDSVFPISRDSKGPHSEDEKIKDDPSLFSPYGYTKLIGEKEVINSGAKAAILRIAYPFGNADFPEKDYLTKLVSSIRLGYPLFTDQHFTPTYLNSLPVAVEKLAMQELVGIYHWVCKGLTTPYDIGVYINEKLKLGLEVKKGFVGDLSYAMFGGLLTKITEEKLGLKTLSWKEAIDDFIPELKSHYL
jgi:dTDP-4-dehydrorhamnose reductase